MNKADLIDAVAAAADLNKATATRAVDALISGITEALKKGEQVALVGFGTFEVRERAARTGRNPRQVRQSISRPPKRPLSKLAKR